MFCKLFHTSIKQGNGYYINISNNKSVGFHVRKAFRGRAVLLGHWATALEIEKQKEDTFLHLQLLDDTKVESQNLCVSSKTL